MTSGRANQVGSTHGLGKWVGAERFIRGGRMAARQHLRSRTRALFNIVQPILPLPFIAVEQQIHKCIKVYGRTATRPTKLGATV